MAEPGSDADVLAALALIKQRHPEAAWTLSKITNHGHMIHPYGIGMGVQLFDPKGQIVFEKRETLEAAAATACDRLDNRKAGHTWA